MLGHLGSEPSERSTLIEEVFLPTPETLKALKYESFEGKGQARNSV